MDTAGELVGRAYPGADMAGFQAKVRPTLHASQLLLWLLGVSGGYLTLAGLLMFLKTGGFSIYLLTGGGALLAFFYLLKRTAS